MKKAIFLDLDDTLITTMTGRQFPVHTDDWRFKLELLPLLQKGVSLGYLFMIVTNQESIAQGFLSEKAFIRKLDNIIGTLEKDLKLKKNKDIFYSYCVENVYNYRKKPQPGMAFELALDYELDLQNSIMIGDSPTDRQFAYNAGIGSYCDITEVTSDLI